MSESSQKEPRYFIIFLTLLAALFISLAIGHFSSGKVATTIIFVIAGIKAYLVLNYFVHLKMEPRYIKVMVASLVAVLLILYVGLVPDVVWVYGAPKI